MGDIVLQSAASLSSLVKRYNQANGTHFTVDQIAETNHLDAKQQVQAGAKVHIPDTFEADKAKPRASPGAAASQASDLMNSLCAANSKVDLQPVEAQLIWSRGNDLLATGKAATMGQFKANLAVEMSRHISTGATVSPAFKQLFDQMVSESKPDLDANPRLRAVISDSVSDGATAHAALARMGG